MIPGRWHGVAYLVGTSCGYRYGVEGAYAAPTGWNATGWVGCGQQPLSSTTRPRYASSQATANRPKQRGHRIVSGAPSREAR